MESRLTAVGWGAEGWSKKEKREKELIGTDNLVVITGGG